jgi:lipoprotein-anchoring transpeptidase ErfK/SrfK
LYTFAVCIIWQILYISDVKNPNSVSMSIQRLICSCKVLLLASLLTVPVWAQAQPSPGTNAKGKEVRDLKITKETTDKYGNIVREVEYYDGQMKITEVVIIPPFPKLGDRLKVDLDTLNRDSLMVYVDKSQYLVALLYRRKRIRQYRAVFGPDPKKDKMMEGDRATPEGWFKVVSKKEHGAWQKFILIDYPNAASYEKFNQRKKEGLIPPNASIGGSVGIHGTFKSGVKMVDWGMGWTDGCVALKPEDIEDLYKFVAPGTRVFVKR